MFLKKRSLVLCVSLLRLFFSMPIQAQDGSKLIELVMYQEFDKAKELIKKGVDVNYQDESSGSTALILSCQYGFLDMVKFLVENKADINLQAKNGYTPLIAAAGVSQEIVEYLISKGADVSLKTKDGTTAFTRSIIGVLSERVTMDVAMILLEKGANVDEAAITGRTEDYTCLMKAARNNHPDLAKFLVKNGADVNAKAKDGKTPLSLAIKKNHTEMIKLLKKLGAK